jgi:hypothetical protein
MGFCSTHPELCLPSAARPTAYPGPEWTTAATTRRSVAHTEWASDPVYPISGVTAHIRADLRAGLAPASTLGNRQLCAGAAPAGALETGLGALSRHDAGLQTGGLAPASPNPTMQAAFPTQRTLAPDDGVGGQGQHRRTRRPGRPRDARRHPAAPAAGPARPDDPHRSARPETWADPAELPCRTCATPGLAGCSSHAARKPDARSHGQAPRTRWTNRAVVQRSRTVTHQPSSSSPSPTWSKVASVNASVWA